MKILEKLTKKQKDVFSDNAATIVVFGDSNTQGCFECFMNEQGQIDTVFETENSYGAKLKHILQVLYPKAQINLINSGISGDNATNALKRIENSVLQYNPDLVILSFGTNDAGGGLGALDQYKNSMDRIFSTLKNNGCDVIFMSSVLKNTYVSHRLTEAYLRELAETQVLSVEQDIDGVFFAEAGKLCKKYGFVYCDCYAKWKKMYENGVDTTNLLSNSLNHPIRELHWLFATSLVEAIFDFTIENDG